MDNMLSSTQKAIEPLKYLTTIDLGTVWEFYQPALELAFTDEEMLGNVDKDTQNTIQRMRLKLFLSRVSTIENSVTGEEVKSNKNFISTSSNI